MISVRRGVSINLKINNPKINLLMVTKILSIFGILFSFSGILMSLYIYIQIENFKNEFWDLYNEKNEDILNTFRELDYNYLMSIQKDIVTPLGIFFLFFLFASIRQILKK